MDSTLIYTESGTIYSQAIPFLSLRGLLEPDHLRKVGIIHDQLDGSLLAQIRGFNKVIEPTISPNTTPTQRRFLASWIASDDKTIAYGLGGVNPYISQVVHDKDLISDWLNDCEYGREFSLELVDVHLYTAWVDGIISDDTMYIKLKVEMSQDATEASPEVLTTNSGKLLVMENGQPFPAFNASTHDHYISILASDGSWAGYPVSYVVSAGNIAISTFPESGYVTSADGKLWANIGIHAVSKT